MSDLISRKAAVDAMSSWDWQELYLPVHFKQLLEELPSAEPRWIPVTERLPENSEEVLITRRTIRFTKDDSGRRIDLGYYYSDLKKWDTLDLDDIEVTAWMPLPEPYEGGDAE